MYAIRSYYVPYYEIMRFLAKRNISINWFFFNQLPESLIEPTSNYIILKYQKGVLASTGAGAINHKLNTNELVIDQQLLDHIEANYTYTEVIRNIGDSMEPDIPNDSVVVITSYSIHDTKLYDTDLPPTWPAAAPSCPTATPPAVPLVLVRPPGPST